MEEIFKMGTQDGLKHIFSVCSCCYMAYEESDEAKV